MNITIKEEQYYTVKLNGKWLAVMMDALLKHPMPYNLSEPLMTEIERQLTEQTETAKDNHER